MLLRRVLERLLDRWPIEIRLKLLLYLLWVLADYSHIRELLGDRVLHVMGIEIISLEIRVG